MVEIDINIEKYKGERPKSVRITDRDRMNIDYFRHGYDEYSKGRLFLTNIDRVCMKCFQKYSKFDHCPLCGTDDFWTGEIGKIVWYLNKYARGGQVRSFLRMSGFNPIGMKKEEMLREIGRLLKEGDIKIFE